MSTDHLWCTGLIIDKRGDVPQLIGCADEDTLIRNAQELVSSLVLALCDETFSFCSLEYAKAVSKCERKRCLLEREVSLTYGEVDCSSLMSVFNIVRSIRARGTGGGVFYDLGSGTGRAIVVAHASEDFSKCIGIEVSRSLYRASMTIQNKYNRWCNPRLQHEAVPIALLCDSFLDVDWSDGDVCFANSTCFDVDLMRALSIKAEALQSGSLFITFTKPLLSVAFSIVRKEHYDMSWGRTTVYIFRSL